MFNPKFINQPQNGADVFPEVTRIPPRLRIIGVDPKTPEGQALLARYRALINSFYIRSSHNASLAGLPQATSSSVFGNVEMRYLNQFGAETVYVDFSVAVPGPEGEKEFELDPGFIFFHDNGWEYKGNAEATDFSQAGVSSSSSAFDYSFPDASYSAADKSAVYDSADSNAGFPGVYNWYSADGTSTIQIPFSARGDDNNPYTTTINNVVLPDNELRPTVEKQPTGLFVNGVYMFDGVHNLCGAAVVNKNKLVVVYYEQERAYDEETEIYYYIAYYSVRIFDGAFEAEPSATGAYTPISEIAWNSGRDIIKQRLTFPHVPGYTTYSSPSIDSHTDFYQALFSQYFFHFSPDGRTCSRITHVYPRLRSRNGEYLSYINFNGSTVGLGADDPIYYTASYIHTIQIPEDLSEEATPTVSSFSVYEPPELEGVSAELTNNVMRNREENWPDTVVEKDFISSPCTGGEPQQVGETTTRPTTTISNRLYIETTQSLKRPLCCGYNNDGELRILCATKTIGPGTYNVESSQTSSYSNVWREIGEFINPGEPTETCGWVEFYRNISVTGNLEISHSYYHNDTWDYAVYDSDMALVADLGVKTGQIVSVPETSFGADVTYNYRKPYYGPPYYNEPYITSENTSASALNLTYNETTYMQFLGIDLRAGVAFTDKSKINTVVANVNIPASGGLGAIVVPPPRSAEISYQYILQELYKATFGAKVFADWNVIDIFEDHEPFIRQVNSSFNKVFRDSALDKEQLFFYENGVNHKVDLDFSRNIQENSSYSSSLTLSSFEVLSSSSIINGVSRYGAFTTDTISEDDLDEGDPWGYRHYTEISPSEYMLRLEDSPWQIGIRLYTSIIISQGTPSFTIRATVDQVSPLFLAGPPSWRVNVRDVYESVYDAYGKKDVEVYHNNIFMYQGVMVDKHILLPAPSGMVIVAPSFRNSYARFDTSWTTYDSPYFPGPDGQQVVYMDQVYSVSPAGTDDFGNPVYRINDLSDAAAFSPAGEAFLTDDVFELGKTSYEVWATFWGFIPVVSKTDEK